MLGMNFPKLFQRDVSSYLCGILYLDPSASLKRIFALPVGVFLGFQLARVRVLVHFFSLPLIFNLHWWPLAFVILSPPLQNFHVVQFQQKMSPLFFLFVCLFFFFISRSRSLSPFSSSSFAGLSPTFSFSPSFSCSIFQIFGHYN